MEEIERGGGTKIGKKERDRVGLRDKGRQGRGKKENKREKEPGTGRRKNVLRKRG